LHYPPKFLKNSDTGCKAAFRETASGGAAAYHYADGNIFHLHKPHVGKPTDKNSVCGIGQQHHHTGSSRNYFPKSPNKKSCELGISNEILEKELSEILSSVNTQVIL